ncbi:hypothetical protein HNY73_018122 [Argiope bruennichi]|uniref:Uncharacterized protein n=1 Tax=Argiope bruennichi TaxID=94029 RepID=A0A8T0EC69_ARGBR|nr:hypothetical protein HNY73_018122 [Argiope bruennichi]
MASHSSAEEKPLPFQLSQPAQNRNNYYNRFHRGALAADAPQVLFQPELPSPSSTLFGTPKSPGNCRRNKLCRSQIEFQEYLPYKRNNHVLLLNILLFNIAFGENP